MTTRAAPRGRAQTDKLSLDKYKSTQERWWAQWGHHLLAERMQQNVACTLYEPITWHLPGNVTYTPDFLHILDDGSLVMVEVKPVLHRINARTGKRKAWTPPGYRDARVRLKVAAELYPWLTWYEAHIDGNGLESLEPIGAQAGE